MNTTSFNSLVQDPTLGNVKRSINIEIILLALEMAILDYNL